MNVDDEPPTPRPPASVRPVVANEASASDAPGWVPGLTLPSGHRLIEPQDPSDDGATWRGISPLDGRPVTICRFLDAANVDPEARATWLRRARAIASLRHPGIAHIEDCGLDEAGRLFLVLEQPESRTLPWLLGQRSRLNDSSAVALLLPVARALAHAHRKDVVHADLRPSAVLLARSDQPNLIQAKLHGFRLAPAAERTVWSPPERRKGDADAHPGEDQWGLAAILYAAIAGRPPFRPPDDGEAVGAGPLSFPRETNLDGRLFAILARATRPDPADRFASMDAMTDALSAWLLRRGRRRDASGHDVEPRARLATGTVPSTQPPTPPAGATPLASLGASAEAVDRSTSSDLLGPLDHLIAEALERNE